MINILSSQYRSSKMKPKECVKTVMRLPQEPHGLNHLNFYVNYLPRVLLCGMKHKTGRSLVFISSEFIVCVCFSIRLLFDSVACVGICRLWDSRLKKKIEIADSINTFLSRCKHQVAYLIQGWWTFQSKI